MTKKDAIPQKKMMGHNADMQNVITLLLMLVVVVRTMIVSGAGTFKDVCGLPTDGADADADVAMIAKNIYNYKRIINHFLINFNLFHLLIN
jgi:hypothetical protein